MTLTICGTVLAIVLGAYALSWRVLAWQREDELRLDVALKAKESGEKLICSSLHEMLVEHGQRIVLRCELEEHHHGPHTAAPYGYVRVHWE